MENYDFSGWATKANLKCSDGLTIMKDAFKHNDGQTVPMVWSHQHNDPNHVLGHALLENREEGVYAYCKFNDTESGQTAKLLVQHGDVSALSIYANRLKKQGNFVSHGEIREVSLVLAGANPGAFIDFVIKHGEESDEEAWIYTDEEISLYHAEEESDDDDEDDSDGEKTVAEILSTLTEDQQKAVYYVVCKALEEEGDVSHSDEDEESEEDLEEDEESDEENDNQEGEDDAMKHNVFENDQQQEGTVLSHADGVSIIEMAKKSNVGSLKAAIQAYFEENDNLKHANFIDEEGNDAIATLFPDYKLLKSGAPETIERDLSWVDQVLNTIHKSPISRIRTRHADARIKEMRAKGYQNKGDEKKISGAIKLISRTTDPQTVYRKDDMHRDDIIDITDFDVVEYQWKLMVNNMKEELALAALIGDGRDEGDPDKIHETHIRSVWNDDELYTIHADVDIEAARKEIQGSDTSVYFGDNYIYAEAIITAALYAREKYKGSGTLDFYCTPHLLNVMLLSRDRNGHRMYSSVRDIAAALNVRNIHTVEQFEGKVRTDADGKDHKLLGLFVNMADYQFGCTKGGEITKFSDFDMDFNKYKYLIETRLSGSLTKLWCAIALEEPVVSAEG